MHTPAPLDNCFLESRVKSYSSPCLSRTPLRPGIEKVSAKVHPYTSPNRSLGWLGGTSQQTGPLQTFQLRQLKSREKASTHSHPERQAAPSRTRTPITSTSTSPAEPTLCITLSFLKFSLFQIPANICVWPVWCWAPSEETHRPCGEIWGNRNLYPFSTFFLTLPTITVHFHLLLKAKVYTAGVSFSTSPRDDPCLTVKAFRTKYVLEMTCEIFPFVQCHITY